MRWDSLLWVRHDEQQMPLSVCTATEMIRACLLWQGLQHGLQDGRVAAPKILPLAFDAVPGALHVPIPLPPLLPRQGRSVVLLVCACLSLVLPWLPLILRRIHGVEMDSAPMLPSGHYAQLQCRCGMVFAGACTCARCSS